MPVSKTSAYATVSLVLRKDQVARMRAMALVRSTPNRAVGLSEIAKEVIEAGLAAVSHASRSMSGASTHDAEKDAA